jgi:hypothetical protein
MLSLTRVFKDDSLLKGLTGLNVRQFEELIPKFSDGLEAADRLRKPKRLRKAGAGRKHKLEDDASKLFFILFYLRVYPTMRFAAFLFDNAASGICEWVHIYQPILEAVLGKLPDMPKRRIDSMEEFERCFPGIGRIVIDATERRTQRPKDSEKQKSHYSGKKKTHTFKNTLITDPESRKTLILLPTVPGSRHDKKDLDESGIVENIPGCIPIDVDLGYKGLENVFENINIPIKKPKNKELTPEQKEENKKFSQKRIRVEHIIGATKRFSCLVQPYRNRKDNFEDHIVITCSALANFYQRTKNAA